MSRIPFDTSDWSKIERIERKGVCGIAYWQTRQFGSMRVRIVECTPGYFADHLCAEVTFFFALKANFTYSSNKVANSR